MKKNLTLLFVLFCLFGGSIWAQTFTQGNLKFTVTDANAKTVSVAKANNDISGDIVIPSTVTNSNVTYTVTTVAEYGFQNTGISAVTIPASVEKIGYYAFQGTQSLTKLTIQDSATPIEFVTGYNLSFGTSLKELYIGRDINRTGDYASYRLLDGAEKVTFGPKVTAIPNNFMSGQDNMHTLIIGDGVKTIGDDAFAGDRYGQPELSVTMGANVESIGARAFQNCFTLKSITLPSKLKTIGSNAFNGTYITSITIPASVTDIEYYAFLSCGQLTSINFEDSDEPVNFVSGYARSFGGSAKEVYIGRDINRTGDYAGERMFDNVTKVTFGPKVTAIPNNFMSGQDNMHTLIIGDGVKTIGDDAFQGDRYGEPELSVTMGANVESIGARAFQSCFALKSITLPAKLKTIGNNAFNGTYITSITIPASVTDIEYYAFVGCDQLTSIKFEDSDQPVNFVTGYTLSFGGAAKEVYLGRDVNRIGDYAGERLFNNVTKVTFGPKFTEIGRNMFNGNRELTSIVIGSGVKTIGQSAFYNCGNLDNIEELKVTMGANVETLADNAFQYCSKLKSITIPSKVKAIGAYAFDGSGLTTLTIPANVTVVNYYAFRNCDALASINIEESTEPLEFVTGYTRSFGYNNPKTVFYGRNVIRTGDYTNERMFNKVTDLTIGDMVTEIPDFMFDGNSELQNATIGTGVKYIGESAFRNCGTSDDVTELKVELGVNVDSLAAYAFQNCKKLQTISLPSTLKVIESCAFDYSGLTALSIPTSVKRLGYYAFRGCDSLTSVRIEESTEPIEFVTGYTRSFGYTKPKTVFYGRNVIRTGDYTNERMFNKVTDLTIGDMVTEIPNFMFDGNVELQNATIGTGVKYIGQSAFRSCGTSDDVTELKVEMGANVDSLAAYAFYDCKKLQAISLPSTLKVIESCAFDYSGLTALSIPTSVKRLGYYAFRGCDSLTSVRIEESAEPIEFVTGYSRSFGSAEKEVFYGRNVVRTGDYTNERIFNKVTKLTISDKVTEIGSNMFNGNNELELIYVAWLTPIDINANVFSSATYNTAKLRIPGGTVNAYKSHQVWKLFLNVEESSFFVTGTATQGGTLTFAGESVTNGTKKVLVDRESDVTFQVKAEENYDFTSLTVNGTAVNVANGIYTYPNLQSNIDVVATFTEKPKFDIKATATGGTVSLNGATPSASQTINVYRDTNVTLTIAAAEGYENPKVTVNGIDVTAQLKDNQLTIENIQEAQTIVVTYAKIKFQIAAETTQNGTIELSKNVVEWGDSFTATFKPATGYEFATATLNGENVTAQVQDGVLTVTNVKENKTVGATFVKQTFTVSISGGGINVSTTTPQYGDNVTVTIDDDPDRTLVSLIVNGQDVTSQVVNGQYIINNVTGNVTIEATFKSTKEFITLTGTYAMFSCPQDLNFTGSDLRAYIASGFNKNTNQVLLVRVYDVPAGTGVFLVGEPSTTYKIPYAESVSYYVNLFKANLQKSSIYATTGDFTNFNFGEQDGDPGFYPIIDYVTLLAQTAYLQLPSSFVAAGVKVSFVFEDDIIDGIEDFRISETDETIYDLAGRRLGKTQKGINIVNGKKIAIK